MTLKTSSHNPSLCHSRSRLAPEHQSRVVKTPEVEPTEEKTVKEESSGKSVRPLRHCAVFLWQQKEALLHVFALLTVTCSLLVWYFCVFCYFCAL